MLMSPAPSLLFMWIVVRYPLRSVVGLLPSARHGTTLSCKILRNGPLVVFFRVTLMLLPQYVSIVNVDHTLQSLTVS